MRFSAAVSGNLTQALDAEVRATSAALRRAVTSAGQEVQSELRTQARGAGMVDGGKAVANAWRLNVYPRPGIGPRTLRPAAFISSNVPEIVDAFERAPTITAKGGRYLAVPTAINRQGGRRGSKPRVTTAMMAKPDSGAFILPMKARAGKLWCLPLRQTQAISRGARRGGRLRAYAGGTGVELFAGRVKNQQGLLRRKLVIGYAPMFLLLPSVRAPKLLDVAKVRGRSGDVLAAAVARELGGMPQ